MHEECFAEFVEKYQPELLRFACSKVTNRDQAEDIVQEALIKVFERVKGLSPDVDPRPYFYEAVRFSMGEFFRKQNHTLEVDISEFEEVLEADDDLSRVEVFADFERALRKFEPDEQEVLVKVLVEGWTTREIAKVYKRRERSVWGKWLQYTAIPCLRENLKDYL